MSLESYGLAYNPADYSALKHSWAMRNGSAIMCDVTGAIWTPPALDYDAQLGAMLIADDPDAANNRPYATPLTSGTLHQITSSEDILLVAAGRTIQGTGVTDPDDGLDTGSPVELLRVAMGDFSSTASSIGASNVGSLHAGYIGDGDTITNAHNNRASDKYRGAYGEDVAIYLTVNRAEEVIACNIVRKDGAFLGPQYSEPFTNAIGTSLAGTSVSMGAFMHANGAYFYGIQLYTFPTLPSDVDTGVLQMLNQWARSAPKDRVPFSGWAD